MIKSVCVVFSENVGVPPTLSDNLEGMIVYVLSPSLIDLNYTVEVLLSNT